MLLFAFRFLGHLDHIPTSSNMQWCGKKRHQLRSTHLWKGYFNSNYCNSIRNGTPSSYHQMSDQVISIIIASVKRTAWQTLDSEQKALWTVSPLPSPNMLYAFSGFLDSLAAKNEDCLKHQRWAQTRSISYLQGFSSVFRFQTATFLSSETVFRCDSIWFLICKQTRPAVGIAISHMHADASMRTTFMSQLLSQ